jgi:chromosome segregation ATPase
VSGLYRRAIDYLQSQRHLRLVRPEDDDDFEGTPEERAQIEDEIRRAVDRNRIQVGPETFRLRPQKGGAGLPLMVNLVALVVIAAGVYFLVGLFDSREQTLVTRTGSVASAEGRLLSALREESAQELSRKDAEIAEIERRLADAEAEREQIRSDAQVRLTEQETVLRAEFEAALEAERARLAGEDLTDEQRAALLAAFRAEQEEALERDLATLEAEAQADVEAQEAAVASLVSEFEASLNAARADREALEAELRERESDLAEREAQLATRFEQREAELSSERAAAVDLLDSLRAQQEQRQLILDQILGFYADVRSSISEGSYDDAATTLASLRSYLEDGPIGSIPELQRRRQVELFLVETLDQQLERRRGEGAVSTRTMIESAGLVAEVGELVSLAEASFEGGDLGEARELYVAALSRIPAIELGYERLEQIEASISERESAQIASLVEDGNVLYRAGRYDEAVGRYGQALAALPADSDVLLERLLNAGYELRAGDSLAELERLRDELMQSTQSIERQASTIAARGATVDTQTEEIRDLRSRLVSVDELLAATTIELRDAEDLIATRENEIDSARRRLATTESLVAELRASLEEARSGATDANGELAEARSDLADANERVAALEGRLREQEELVSRIDSYREAFANLAADASAATSSLELLETKLLILRIVGSDALRADYPDLYEQLNAYLDALVAEQRADAVEDTLAEVTALIDDLAARTTASMDEIDALSTAYPTLARSPAAAATEDLLARLRGMGR